MTRRDARRRSRSTVHAVTQCVLRVDDRNLRVAKAEGRDAAVPGTVLHWHQESGRASSRRPRSAAAWPRRCARCAARASSASTTSATSPASRRARSHRSSAATAASRWRRSCGSARRWRDDRRPAARRGAGRLSDRPPHRRSRGRPRAHRPAARRPGPADRPRPPRPARVRAPSRPPPGTGIVAVASGLVQVQVAGQTPAVAPRRGARRRQRRTSRAGATSVRPRPSCSGSSTAGLASLGA